MVVGESTEHEIHPHLSSLKSCAEHGACRLCSLVWACIVISNGHVRINEQLTNDHTAGDINVVGATEQRAVLSARILSQSCTPIDDILPDSVEVCIREGKEMTRHLGVGLRAYIPGGEFFVINIRLLRRCSQLLSL